MILLVAPAGDDVAEELSALAEQAGSPCCRWPEDRNRLRISCRTGDDGTMHSSLVYAHRDTPVTAILNRGVAAASFADFEALAALWGVMAGFSGRVINRPSEGGFLPDLSFRGNRGFRDSRGGLELAPPGTDGGQTPPAAAAPRANAAVVVGGEASFLFASDEVRPCVEDALDGLVDEIAAADVRFCSLLLSARKGEPPSVVDFRPCPAPRHLAADAGTRRAIQESVLRWLLG